MTENPTNPAFRLLRHVARFLVGIFVVGYALLDGLLFPLVRPLLAYLSRLQLFAAFGALLVKLPPYVVLLLLAVPFFLLEPLKLVALYRIAIGHVVQGTVLTLVAHGLSILTLERLYQAGKPQLLKIGWFMRLMGWLGGIRDYALAFARSTPAWKWAAQLVREIRAWFRNLLRSVR